MERTDNHSLAPQRKKTVAITNSLEILRLCKKHVGPNLLDRLLMELRDEQLTWSLPEDALAFTSYLTSHLVGIIGKGGGE